MNNSPDDRSKLALAYGWAVRIMTISLEMVVPGLIGLWIDRQLGTVMLFLVLGVILGFTVGMVHLVRLAASVQPGDPSEGKSSQRKSSDDPSKKQRKR